MTKRHVGSPGRGFRRGGRQARHQSPDGLIAEDTLWSGTAQWAGQGDPTLQHTSLFRHIYNLIYATALIPVHATAHISVQDKQPHSSTWHFSLMVMGWMYNTVALLPARYVAQLEFTNPDLYFYCRRSLCT